MPVPASINDLSTIAGNNSPAGSESPTLTDDYLRTLSAFIAFLRDSGTSIDGLAVKKDSIATTGAAILPPGTTAQRPASPQNGMLRYNTDISDFEGYIGGAWVARSVFTRAVNEAPIVTLASASTVDIGAAAANTINISGSVTINSLGTVAPGARRTLVFQAAPVITHNATSLILPGGASITAAAGDVAEFVSLGVGNWLCLQYRRVAGISAVMTRSTPQATTSGTAIDFTGIPSWVRRITVMLSGVSTSGTSIIQMQLGSGSITTAGYNATRIDTSPVSNIAISAVSSGFSAYSPAAGTDTCHGQIVLANLSGNIWTASGGTSGTSGRSTSCYGGITLSGVLDRIRLTTVNGTDTFDAGTAGIIYEG